MRLIRMFISVVLVLSLFVPWETVRGGFFMSTFQFNGFWFLMLMSLEALISFQKYPPQALLLCLPLYFIVNLWFGRDSRSLAMCRFFLAGASIGIQLYGWYHQDSFTTIEWGYWLALLTIGVGMIKDLYILAMMMEAT